MIILLFGQPASGKTTLAGFIAQHLEAKKQSKVIRIDGDKWRDITKNKDYSKDGRLKNLKGAFDMALYLEREGYTIILSFVTPYQELRSYLSENADYCLQIYLTYPGGRGRDDKFADDFEKPKNILTIDTSKKNVDDCLTEIWEYMKDYFINEFINE